MAYHYFWSIPYRSTYLNTNITRLFEFITTDFHIEYDNKEFQIYRHVPYMKFEVSRNHLFNLIKLDNDMTMVDVIRAFTWSDTSNGEEYWKEVSRIRKTDYFHTLFLQIYCMSMR